MGLSSPQVKVLKELKQLIKNTKRRLLAMGVPENRERKNGGWDLSKLTLSGQDMSCMYLRESLFNHAILRGTNLEGSNLEDSTFNNADCTDANFTKANMRNTTHCGTYLDATVTNADFYWANLLQVHLSSASRLAEAKNLHTAIISPRLFSMLPERIRKLRPTTK